MALLNLSEFLIAFFTLLPYVILLILFMVWRMIEKRKQQRQEMQILLLAKIAQKLGVEESSVSEIIQAL